MAKKLLSTYFFLIVIPLIIVTIVSYSTFKRNMETHVAQSVEHSVLLVQHEAEAYFGNLVALSAQIMQQDSIAEDSSMTSLMADRIDGEGKSDHYVDYMQNQKIHLYLNTNVLDRQRDIKMAIIRLTNGETFQSKRTAANIDESELEQMQREVIESKKQWMVQPIPLSDNASEFYLIRKINLPGSNRFLGILVFEVKMDTFAATVQSSLLSGQEAVVLWQQNSVLYGSVNWWHALPIELGPKKSESLERDSPKGKILVTYSSPSDSDWAVVTYFPFSKLSEGIIPIQRTLMAAAGACIVIAILLALLLVRNILRPIWSLRNAMRRMSKGFLQTQVAVKGKDEMAELTHVFNSMSRELNQMIDKVYLAELSQKDAELQALQAQIDPHFLYNTLESIRMLAEMQGSPDAGKMLRAMAVLFRAATDTESMVTLEKEASLLEQYAMLHEIRLNGPLELSIELEPSVRDCLVPKLTLQPLLENCFKHAYVGCPEGVPIVVHLRASREDEDLIMDLTDFGAGISGARLEEVEQALNSGVSRTEPGSRVGLLNVHERIRKRWGNGYGISIFSKPEMGTVVSLKVPCQLRISEGLGHEPAHRG
ncbi:sensor histidine kinase [Cohnella endophytica]|uniref:Sensor histidine kinase n=1 Tax=Cohnella endophytica TaxID=2419778 RepID=A0A494XZJ0_9BACL|nr:histidine kinase [Cohnella endophytica]RKP54459.1 sensor histidine kinase [Cohnella endophytica]